MPAVYLHYTGCDLMQVSVSTSVRPSAVSSSPDSLAFSPCSLPFSPCSLPFSPCSILSSPHGLPQVSNSPSPVCTIHPPQDCAVPSSLPSCVLSLLPAISLPLCYLLDVPAPPHILHSATCSIPSLMYTTPPSLRTVVSTPPIPLPLPTASLPMVSLPLCPPFPYPQSPFLSLRPPSPNRGIPAYNIHPSPRPMFSPGFLITVMNRERQSAPCLQSPLKLPNNPTF